MWRNRFGRGFEPVVRQNTEWMDVGGVALPLCYKHTINCNEIKIGANSEIKWNTSL
jgi:hypothetical protein